MTPFPTPWSVDPTGPEEFVVRDANGRRLFYIHGDEGDEDSDVEPSVLFYSDNEHVALLEEITRCLTSKS